MPKVSVMMPAYNVEKYIGEAIESILNQTFQDYELIIIDDGSVDATYQIMQEYAQKSNKIRVFQNEKNEGLVFTRNRLLELANGEYLAALDSDDISLLDRLEKQVNFLDKNPDIDLLGGGLEFFRENSDEKNYLLFLTDPEQIACKLLFHNMFTQTAIIFRNKVKNLKYDNHPLAEDYDLWVRISWQGKVTNLRDILALCRLHPESISARRDDDMKKNDRLIHIKQLRRLGITPTEKELDIHRKIAHQIDTMTEEQFEQAINWIQKLLKANQENQKYPLLAFEKELHSRLLSFFPFSFQFGDVFIKALKKTEIKYLLPFKTRFKFWFLAKSKGKNSSMFYKNLYKTYNKLRNK
ncbi:glycosyl transferase [Bernardetia litoralis DSM 6794]|uniref:Glycosyl transferase n=1 Tax=Bernardetia litoralis (strain ATCC 23117 / DSM 6794 / NBRC 15988 / NCIMB 1366 / Fx l1 / Sio-4) TaxID=880071 RepID=I4AI27_BERLS|nr:glycosyltransferase family A protein [Bernardetia litoralis]AFM03612.1 glycosyl transferase [Bernardetia litoralis DSM 6794]